MPEEADRGGQHFRQGEDSALIHTAVTYLIKGIIRLTCRVHAAELSAVPLQGPYIIVTNHINFLEVPLLYTFFYPRPLIGLVKVETWKNPLIGGLASLWKAIPLDREKPDFSALRRSLAVLAEGKFLAIAPEGTRSGNGKLQPGQSGVVYLALKSGLPIIPVVHHGGEKYWKNLAAGRRTDFYLRVGQPFFLKKERRFPGRETRLSMVQEIMYQMARLLPPDYRGAYADLAQASTYFLLPQKDGK
jgi:1-acyl-sn-glycerol-3-phosphate acyltransferase